jgi:hypothetical protein
MVILMRVSNSDRVLLYPIRVAPPILSLKCANPVTLGGRRVVALICILWIERRPRASYALLALTLANRRAIILVRFRRFTKSRLWKMGNNDRYAHQS